LFSNPLIVCLYIMYMTYFSSNPIHGVVYLIQHYVIKVCQWLAEGWWFSSGIPVSSTNTTDRHNIAETLLKVALNIYPQNIPKMIKWYFWYMYCYFERIFFMTGYCAYLIYVFILYLYYNSFLSWEVLRMPTILEETWKFMLAFCKEKHHWHLKLANYWMKNYNTPLSQKYL
jgi:hypothetical protein